MDDSRIPPGCLSSFISLECTSLSALHRRIAAAENNFCPLESIALEGFGEVKWNILEQDKEHKEGITNLELKLTEALSVLQEEVEALKLRLEETAEASGHGPVTVRETRIEAPKPKIFRGERSAQDVKNFLWQLDAYFEHVSIANEAAKIRTTAMYLTDTAMLWWQRKNVDMEKGTCLIDTWEQFKEELKRQFYPQNVVHEARRKLRELKKTSSICEYVNDFTKLTLQMPNLTSEDLLFNFLNGLQNWAKQELQRRHVNTVDEVIVMAESLSDFWTGAPKGNGNMSQTVAAPKTDPNRGKGKYVPNRNNENRGNRNQSSQYRKNYEQKKKGGPQRDVCYLCRDSSHFARYCPTLRKLGAIVASHHQQGQTAAPTGKQPEERGAPTDGAGQEKNKVVGLFNHMDLFNHMTLAAIAAQLPRVRPRESLFVDAKLNGKDVCIMMDTSATHNFVTEERARDLGLVFVSSDTLLKTVNALPTTVHGFDPKVHLALGGWQGLTDFTVAPMDVFDIILGLDFWYEINTFISPHLNQLHISDPEGSCVVTIIQVPQNRMHMSVMQLVKGFKKGEPTFFVTLTGIIENSLGAVTLPPCIEQVLENNKDVMPKELPK
ncbi:uncharacterized protein [Nicotiana tomentosiformis]|uniref:uncharacterized protein n=1 Tax=Nicotiana tomentosiformis TaxID=4098 RepID=UPI00388C8425